MDKSSELFNNNTLPLCGLASIFQSFPPYVVSLPLRITSRRDLIISPIIIMQLNKLRDSHLPKVTQKQCPSQCWDPNLLPTSLVLFPHVDVME